jgi:hypothetical protein
MNKTEIKQETETPRKSRTAKPKRTAVELLNDPSIVTVSVSQAAMILGISKQTAHKTFHETGYLLKGNRIPVLVCGNRTIVSIEHIRAALDYPTPLTAEHLSELERVISIRNGRI